MTSKGSSEKCGVNASYCRECIYSYHLYLFTKQHPHARPCANTGDTVKNKQTISTLVGSMVVCGGRSKVTPSS